MLPRQWLGIVCAIAALHGIFFLWYQSPDWSTAWSDQDGYRRLGQVLATTGKFTRFPDAPAFVPEVIRTPAYPVFVAVIYRLFGVGQTPVAVAQIALFVAICILVYLIGRRVASEHGHAQIFDFKFHVFHIRIGSFAIRSQLFPPSRYGSVVVEKHQAR